MVLTLFKHEIARTWRLQLAAFAIPTVLVAFGALLVRLDLPVVSPLALALSTVGASMLMALVQVHLVWDYWRSSYSGLGYLTHSVPVRGGTLFGVKLCWATLLMLVAAGWAVLLVGAVNLAEWAPAGQPASTFFDQVAATWSQVTTAMSAGLWVAAVAFLLVSVALTLVQFHFSISVGYESPLARLGHAGPVVVYLATVVALQVVFLIGFVAVPFGLGMGDGGLSVVPLSLAQLFSDQNQAMPLGFVPVMVLAVIVLVWRTVVSWNSRVSLR